MDIKCKCARCFDNCWYTRHFERAISNVARSLAQHTGCSRLGIVGTGYRNSYQRCRASRRLVPLRAKIFDPSPPAEIYDVKNFVLSAGISADRRFRATRLANGLAIVHRKCEKINLAARSVRSEFIKKERRYAFPLDSFPLWLRNRCRFNEYPMGYILYFYTVRYSKYPSKFRLPHRQLANLI